MPRLTPAQSVAVIGAGVAGCAVVAQLRRLGWSGPISLWEMGRGPGGRASCRRSRRDPALRIDHGAPLLSLTPELPPPDLLAPLLAGGWLQPFTAPLAWLGGDGLRLGPGDDPLAKGLLYGAPQGMDQLGRGLLQLAAAAGPAPIERFQCLVAGVEPRSGGGWQLLDAARQPLAAADWLLVSSSLIAHPRSRPLLGWPEPPLQAAAARLGDPRLDRALAAIAAIDVEPGCNLLLVLPAVAAAAWRALPFRLLAIEPALQDGGVRLRRLTIQPLDDGRVVVVAHGSAAFARRYQAVVGRGSAAAVLAPAGDAGAEAAVIAGLSQALAELVSPWIGAADLALEQGERQLMRWGAAFPLPPGLPAADCLCPDSRLGFCGDMVAGPGFGRIEGALRSGEQLAAALRGS